MNPILEEIYSTIIPSAPYIIAAYALIWFVLLIFVLVSMRSLKKSEARIEILEESIQNLKAQTDKKGTEEPAH